MQHPGSSTAQELSSALRRLMSTEEGQYSAVLTAGQPSTRSEQHHVRTGKPGARADQHHTKAMRRSRCCMWWNTASTKLECCTDLQAELIKRAALELGQLQLSQRLAASS